MIKYPLMVVPFTYMKPREHIQIISYSQDQKMCGINPWPTTFSHLYK